MTSWDIYFNMKQWGDTTASREELIQAVLELGQKAEDAANAGPPETVDVFLGGDDEPTGPQVTCRYYEDPGDPSVGIQGWGGYVADWSTVRDWNGQPYPKQEKQT